MSVLETLKALDEQRAALLSAAKQEALDRAHKAIADLKQLGFDYTLIDRSRRALAQGLRNEHFETEAPKLEPLDVACPVCGITTFPWHDAAAHKNQEPKRPFTAEELAQAGFALTKPRSSMFDETLPGS